jgi:hypothetical protein
MDPNNQDLFWRHCVVLRRFVQDLSRSKVMSSHGAFLALKKLS